MNFINHFITITRHKLLVMKYCFRIGLYKQGLLHDLSKYAPIEFINGCRYYQGFRSPNNAEREDKGYSDAWMHHKGRNKHHFEYWLDYSVDPSNILAPAKMPLKYVLEMVVDRIAASKNYKGKDYTDDLPLEYYLYGKSRSILHPVNRKQVVYLLTMLKEKGEDYTMSYMRKLVYRMKKEQFDKVLSIIQRRK